eukprot:CAMPEP_0177651298 /NCGR_PEP_ID=MMETSP0447-20121125/12464_1 /TAXON_ID=0 /ORGANISM="Stygamoeba regulata, Strain BSH-02190019" /LENGTH=215 /DNA_ID=CAMNT_0019154351 /DNA_START=54 /DNA_END=697 /DNA_ORIENTATION=-
MADLKKLSDLVSVKEHLKTNPLAVIIFSAAWSQPAQQVVSVCEQLQKRHTNIAFAQVLPEEAEEVSAEFSISSVPTLVFLRNATRVDVVVGADIPLISRKVGAFSTTSTESGAASEERLKSLINQTPVVLFMKGSPEEPRCGFSRKIVDLLKGDGISFSHFDILSDNAVREGLKKYSNWPTYPQLYIQGKLVGGLDICKELSEEGELKDMAAAAG